MTGLMLLINELAERRAPLDAEFTTSSMNDLMFSDAIVAKALIHILRGLTLSGAAPKRPAALASMFRVRLGCSTNCLNSVQICMTAFLLSSMVNFQMDGSSTML